MAGWQLIVGWLVFWFAGLVFAAPAEPNVTFERRAWSPVEGAPSGAWSIAQSQDGFLWFAGPGGLHRFDGEKFTQVDHIYGEALRSRNVTAVLPLQRGIAVSYQFGGMSIFSPAGARHFGPENGLPAGSVSMGVQMPDGQLYVGTTRGIAVLSEGRWDILDKHGIPAGRVVQIRTDGRGNLWALVNHILYVRPAGQQDFAAVMQVATWSLPEIVRGRMVAPSPEGKIFQLEPGRPPLLLLKQTTTETDTIFEGPLATVWAWLGNGGGLVRLRQQPGGSYVQAESFEGGRLNKSVLVASLVDREGNAWISTFNGIERLRAQRIHEVRLDETIFTPYVHQGLGGDMLVAGLSSHNVQRISAAGREQQFNIANVSAMWRENADSLWAGSPAGLFHITRLGIRPFPLPPAVPPFSRVQAIATDSRGSVWVSIVRQGLFQLAAGQWTQVDTHSMGKDPIPIIMLRTKSGELWLGFTDNRIGKIVDGAVRPFSRDASNSIGNVLSLLEVDGRLLAGGENGLVWVRPDGNRPLAPALLEQFRGVAGMAVDQTGTLWLHGTDGVYSVARKELEQFWRAPEYRVRWEVLSLADGVRGNAAQISPLPSLALAEDGRLFYATNSQVGWIDPLNLRKNTRPPDVIITGLRADNTVLEPKQPLQLAAGTTSLEIMYAVTALSVPEKVKIKYQLSGVDGKWQEPNGARLARYTNLGPGAYTFQVIAANEDGVWNMQGASLQLEILPHFWQTTWFRLLMLSLLTALLVQLYRWRIAMAAERAAERTAAQLEERARIARNLHDNLLQGVHALILRSSTILNRLPKGSQEERILESVLTQAEKLVEDTRDEVMALRSSQSGSARVAQLQQELKAAGQRLEGQLSMEVTGDPDLIRPDAAREICQVMKEAILNAVRHAGAQTIQARLDITPGRIAGTVLDNGAGLPEEVARNGIPGHWGIVGMRERIARLGGELIIERNGDAGTVVRFVLTAAAVFH